MKKAYIHFDGLTWHWWAKTVFENISGHVNGGDVVGLIWDNGTGKSTLLKLLAGSLELTEGTIEKKWELWLVTQWLDAEWEVTVGRYLGVDLRYEEREGLVALGKAWWDELWLDQVVTELSGGQQTKVRIAKMLLDDVHILLLDEPTNHLDSTWTHALTWLVKRFHGPVIIVSHDRAFLDQVCTHIYDLNWQHLEVYTWNYTAYLEQRAARYEQMMQERKQQQRKKKDMEHWLADIRQRASVYKSPRWWRLLRSRQKMYDRQFGKEAVSKPKATQSMQLKAHGWTHKYKKICDVLGWPVLVWDRFLYEIEPLKILGQDRVLLSWTNGSWKSTLLNLLKDSYRSWESDLIVRWNDIRVRFFDQHDALDDCSDTIIQRCHASFPDSRDDRTIRSKLSWAGIPHEDIGKRVSQLSYGQRVKLRFLEMLTQKYDFLVLDEPTNHLDIATRESLELMLQDYQGAILVVSHDEWFVQTLWLEREWEIEDGMCCERDI